MKKKKKLLHIQLLPLLSGVQNMMLLLLDSLDKERYEIYVICKPNGPLVNRLEESGYHCLPVKSLRRNLSLLDFVAFWHIFSICRKYRFDIVHTHSSKTGFLGRIAARLAGVPKIIHTVHGFPFHEHQFFIARNLFLTLEVIAARFCDFLVMVNRHERDWAIKTKLFPANRIMTIYNSVIVEESVEPRVYGEMGTVTPPKTNPELTGYFVFGTVARFSRQKNMVNLTQAAISLCRNESNIKFVLIGDGETWDRCYDLVASAGMNRRILMPGWQKNVTYWLMNMDVLVLYSLWEGLPISILEAMSLGIPVVASDIKGNNELIDNDNGILLPLDDHILLRRTLSELPSRKPDLERWSRNTLTKCRSMFDLNSFIRGYEKLYESEVQQ